jgi:hypothetical protein
MMDRARSLKRMAVCTTGTGSKGFGMVQVAWRFQMAPSLRGVLRKMSSKVKEFTSLFETARGGRLKESSAMDALVVWADSKVKLAAIEDPLVPLDVETDMACSSGLAAPCMMGSGAKARFPVGCGLLLMAKREFVPTRMENTHR